MRHHTSRKFREHFENLSDSIHELAKGQFALLKTNSVHPSLHFKKVGKFWSVRIGIQHRALAVQEGEDLIWFWIGRHDEYDRLVGGR